MMRHFKGYVSTNIIGSRCTFEFEIDDDATAEEIDEVAKECMFDLINWNYSEVTQ